MVAITQNALLILNSVTKSKRIHPKRSEQLSMKTQRWQQSSLVDKEGIGDVPNPAVANL